MSDERRASQRLTLRQPLDGWFGDYAVRLVDVSASGAQLEHEEPIPEEAHGLLRFWWRGEELEILARTARTIHEKCTAVEFAEDSPTLNAQIAVSAAELLRASEANARGDRAANVIGDETLTAASRTLLSGFISWTLTPDGWKANLAPDPTQPSDGFTISASVPEHEVEMLRRTYEAGDAESRSLTRMLAGLSVTPS